MRSTANATSNGHFNRALKKLVEKGVLQAQYEEKPVVTRKNFRTGQFLPLEPLAAALFDFIISPVELWPKGVTTSDWDRARYAFQTLWSEEYYELLD